MKRGGVLLILRENLDFRLWETDYHGAKTCTDSRSIMVEEVLSKWTRQKGLRFSAGKERNIQNGGDH